MAEGSPGGAAPVLLDLAGLDALIQELRSDGRTVVGPTVRHGTVALEPIDGVTDLPRGVGDEQAPGRYRLRDRGDGQVFGQAVGPQSAKRWLFPSREQLLAAAGPPEAGALPQRLAFLGLRGCDLAALAVLDRVLLSREYPDTRYARRRADVLVVAVACTAPAATCFCVAQGTGPAVGPGADVTLTELPAAQEPRFVARAVTEQGRDLVERVAARTTGSPATADDLALEDRLLGEAAASMTDPIGLGPQQLRDRLYGAVESPHWEQVAQRCLACAGCTMVCPTCFCTSVEDVDVLSAEGASRWRVWDSCFTADLTYLHGGSVRSSVASRYRQWVTHKLGAWVDQFGTSGCVGCGRCTTWCPAGIDLRAEVAAVVAPSPEVQS